MIDQPSYYEQRLSKLGITDENNKIGLLYNDTSTTPHSIQTKEEQIFRKHDKGIEIIVYTLDREPVRIEKDGSRWKKDWSIVRLEKPIINKNGDEIKYLMPKGHGSHPFFPPSLIEKFENKTKIDCLYLTEGFFKAFKGHLAGIDVVGLASITHLKNKEKGGLHEDILRLIRNCDIKRVAWLVDGDCLDISRKFNDTKKDVKERSKIDLYKRPNSFFISINTFKQLLDDYEVDKYFMHVDTDAIVADYKVDRDEVKGLDDILIKFPNLQEEIAADIKSVSKKGYWFSKFNITFGLSKVRDHFHINNPNIFYLFHADRNSGIKNREFTFNGTKYKYDEEKAECQIIVPGEATQYFRVGDDYFKFIMKPNKYKQLERHFDGRLKTTITDDHGKHIINHIPKYEAFANVPDHVNFQQVINNCFNVYSPMDHTPVEEPCEQNDCPSIMNFIRHIFSQHTVSFLNPKTKQRQEVSMLDLGLDYIQLLYQQPWEKLPILCLVSKENNTGKSTFGKLLKQIFGGNAAIVGNQDLAGDFNKHWSTKTIVICDETKIDKQTVIEKVKSLSTADKIMMNAKGRDHVEIDCFIKFIFITNNEDNFIYATEDDIRYWVIKVPTIKEENPTLLDDMIEEIPSFLSFLNGRKLSTEKLNRMWFHPQLLKTEALKKVIQYSMPAIVKDIKQRIQDMFLDFEVDRILMSRQDVMDEFFKGGRYETNYVEKVLKETLKLDHFHTLSETDKDLFGNPVKQYKTCRYTYPRWESLHRDGKQVIDRVDVSKNGRPFIFERSAFVDKDMIVEGDAESAYIESMKPDPGKWKPLQPGNNQTKDELPFG